MNVILDLFAVISLHMGVAGVAIATVFAQGISAVISLLHSSWPASALSRRAGRKDFPF